MRSWNCCPVFLSLVRPAGNVLSSLDNGSVNLNIRYFGYFSILYVYDLSMLGLHYTNLYM